MPDGSGSLTLMLTVRARCASSASCPRNALGKVVKPELVGWDSE